MSLTFEDLKNTILPFISIDEFEPKSGLNTEIIVVAFYAEEQGPVQDLNTFIQRGSFDVIDTEASPNPDENGRYLLFIEFERNEVFAATFDKFIRDIENLTGTQEWQVKPYLADHTMAIDDPELYNHIITTPGEYKNKKEFGVESEIKESFKNATVVDLTIADGCVIFTDRSDSVGAKIEDFGEYQTVSAKHRLKEAAINLSPRTEIHCLDVMLGEDWHVFDMGKYVALESNTNEEVLLVSDVQFIYGSNK